MPIYEYYCGKCRKEFELMLPISKVDKAALCPVCGAAGAKLVSACASKIGFYVRAPESQPFRGHLSPRDSKKKKVTYTESKRSKAKKK